MNRKTILSVLALVLLMAAPGMAASAGSSMNSDPKAEYSGDAWVKKTNPNQSGANASNWMPYEVRGTPTSTEAAHRNQDDDYDYDGDNLGQHDGKKSNIRRTGTSEDGYYLYDSRNPNVGKIRPGGQVVHPGR